MNQRAKHIIINADDFHISAGVSRAIRRAACLGVISSTSAFVNGAAQRYHHDAERAAALGIGLHFNITFGRPLAPRSQIKTLITRAGKFKSIYQHLWSHTASEEVRIELEAQLARFHEIFGKWPTHIDSHHHVHYFKAVYRAFIDIAKKYNLPVRKRYLRWSKRHEDCGIVAPDYAFFQFRPQAAWTQRKLINALGTLRPGVSEFIVHPGFSDSYLGRKSSFNIQREQEYNALCSEAFRTALRKAGVSLINFADLSRMRSK